MEKPRGSEVPAPNGSKMAAPSGSKMAGPCVSEVEAQGGRSKSVGHILDVDDYEVHGQGCGSVDEVY